MKQKGSVEWKWVVSAPNPMMRVYEKNHAMSFSLLNQRNSLANTNFYSFLILYYYYEFNYLLLLLLLLLLRFPNKYSFKYLLRIKKILHKPVFILS